MRKQVFVIHGWGGNPNSDWLPWVKNQLEQRGYTVFVPEMPDTDNPQIDAWVDKLTEVIGKPEHTDVLIGHSIGCQTIIRYLESSLKDTKVEKVILVAPWHTLSEEIMSDEGDSVIAKPWIETPIDFGKVRDKANSFIALFSEDDPDVPFEENNKWFNENLGVRTVVFKDKGHFTTADGVVELPEVVKFL